MNETIAGNDAYAFSLLERMLENRAVLMTTYHADEPRRATVQIIFDTHDEASSFVNALSEARKLIG